MPRVSSLRRWGLVVLSLAGIYVLVRSVISVSSRNDASLNLSPVRSKFLAKEELNAKDVSLLENVECEADATCQWPDVFIWTTLETNSQPPVVCVNGEKIFNDFTLSNGFSVAALDAENASLIWAKHVTVDNDDRELLEALTQASADQFVVIVSTGEVSSKMSVEAQRILKSFGSWDSLSEYIPGTKLLFAGRLGAPKGTAQQTIIKRWDTDGKNFSTCWRTQIARGNEEKDGDEPIAAPRDWISDNLLPQLDSAKGRKIPIVLGKELLNCGVQKSCELDEIPMTFYSGKDKNDSPSICVNNNFVMDRDLNNSGRGLNIVVVDGKTKQVMRHAHFDTYAQDSEGLVMFLEQLVPGEIVAVVTFDEASTRLSDSAREIIAELGSSLVTSLKFRASWYFVGQKGIDGYTAFEDLTMPTGTEWAKPIDKKICVPSNLNGRKSEVEVNINATSHNQNSARRHFCGRYDGYEDFCAADRLEEEIIPRALSDHSRASNPIFSVPILVVGGLNMNSIRVSLESLLAQQGIEPRNVVLAFDQAYHEVLDLSSLFHVRALPLNTSSSYNEALSMALHQMVSFFPSAPCFVVIEEDTVLAEDMLYFLDQLTATFLLDTTVDAVLTFNENGFNQTSSMNSVVYRVQNPTLEGAYLIRRNACDKLFASRNENATAMESITGFAYAPDVSRIEINRADNINMPESTKRLWADEPRRTSRYMNITLKDIDKLTEDQYDEELIKLIQISKPINSNILTNCQQESSLPSILKTMKLDKDDSFSMEYSANLGKTEKIAKCFHLMLDERGVIFNTYKGVTRFWLDDHPGFLIESTSELLAGGSSPT